MPTAFPTRMLAQQSCEALDGFMKKIGLWMGLEDKGVPEEELPALGETVHGAARLRE